MRYPKLWLTLSYLLTYLLCACLVACSDKAEPFPGRYKCSHLCCPCPRVLIETAKCEVLKLKVRKKMWRCWTFCAMYIQAGRMRKKWKVCKYDPIYPTQFDRRVDPTCARLGFINSLVRSLVDHPHLGLAAADSHSITRRLGTFLSTAILCIAGRLLLNVIRPLTLRFPR